MKVSSLQLSTAPTLAPFDAVVYKLDLKRYAFRRVLFVRVAWSSLGGYAVGARVLDCGHDAPGGHNEPVVFGKRYRRRRDSIRVRVRCRLCAPKPICR
jgi:hypothetical protein